MPVTKELKNFEYPFHAKHNFAVQKLQQPELRLLVKKKGLREEEMGTPGEL